MRSNNTRNAQIYESGCVGVCLCLDCLFRSKIELTLQFCAIGTIPMKSNKPLFSYFLKIIHLKFFTTFLLWHETIDSFTPITSHHRSLPKRNEKKWKCKNQKRKTAGLVGTQKNWILWSFAFGLHFDSGQSMRGK